VQQGPVKTTAAEWRAQVLHECPVLHDVVLEERDEYMTYRILLGLNAHLQYGSQKPYCRTNTCADAAISDVPGVDGTDLDSQPSMGELLKSSSEGATARVNAALRWALDERAGNDCGIHALPEWAHPTLPVVPPQPEFVAVLCGPAHVDALATRIGGMLDGSSAGRHFLAANSALMPHLLFNSTWPWAHLRTGEGSIKKLTLLVEAVMEDFDGGNSKASTNNIRGRGQDVAFQGFGPITRLADFFFGNKKPEQGTAPSLYVPGAPAFLHNRLRDLSDRPLPVWPVFAGAYVILPILIFIVVPAKLEIWFVLPHTSK